MKERIDSPCRYKVKICYRNNEVVVVDAFEITSTSRDSAVVTPLILRGGTRRRLVFKPLLVNNVHNSDASVKGVFVYQVKKDSDDWEDIESIGLNTFRAGDNFKLELSSSEVLDLFNHIYKLYDHMDNSGIQFGTETLVAVSGSRSSQEIEEILNAVPEGESAQAILNWMESRGVAVAASILESASAQRLENFSAAVGVARLRNFIEEARKNLSNSSEDYWQKLFEANSWVLGQVYSYPAVIIRGQAYLGGKSIASNGGNIADFLYKNSLTDNALIVEIKTPTERLTSTKPYRNNAYSCTKELAGSVQQVLQNLYTLRSNYATIAGEDDPEFRIFSPRCLVVIGCMDNEIERDRKRSFELFRNNQRDVDVVTFDELVVKAETLLALFEEGQTEDDESQNSDDFIDW